MDSQTELSSEVSSNQQTILCSSNIVLEEDPNKENNRPSIRRNQSLKKQTPSLRTSIRAESKWEVSSPPKIVTSSHSGLNFSRQNALPYARPTNSSLSINSNLSNLSTTSLLSVQSGLSSTSLIRKLLTVEDIKINVNEYQLEEFRNLMLEAFKKV